MIVGVMGSVGLESPFSAALSMLIRATGGRGGGGGRGTGGRGAGRGGGV